MAKRIVITCEDMDCKFKLKIGSLCGIANECALDIEDAQKFYRKHGFTTCEYGCGEKKLAYMRGRDDVYIKRLRR